jgi:hypothetical protein
MNILKVILSKQYKYNNNDIVIMVDGGFCSVLTKYAMGRCFEKISGRNVKYDLSWYDQQGMDCDGKFSRNFEILNVFPNINFK